MKTVSGGVASSKPICLSKAAKILSKFVSAENGASQAVSAYLRRASDFFNDLALLHRELKPSRSANKHRKPRSETSRLIVSPGDAEENPREERPAFREQSGVRDFGSIEEIYTAGKRHKKKERSDVGYGDNDGSEVENRVDGESVRVEEKRRKWKSGEVQHGEVDDSAERHSKKKRR